MHSVRRSFNSFHQSHGRLTSKTPHQRTPSSYAKGKVNLMSLALKFKVSCVLVDGVLWVQGMLAHARTHVYGTALKCKTSQVRRLHCRDTPSPVLRTHRKIEILALKKLKPDSLRFLGAGFHRQTRKPVSSLIPQTESSPGLRTEAFALGDDPLRELVAGLHFWIVCFVVGL